MRGGELEDEQSFLLRSLEDLDRERDAGDLSDDDHAALHDEYVARAAALLRGDGPPASPGRATTTEPGRPPGGRVRGGRTRTSLRAPGRRRVVGAAAGIVLVGAIVWAVAAHVSNRLPGQTLSGSITLSASQQTQRTLAQAQSLEGEGDAVDALKLYQSVLDHHPDQEEALAEVGWLEFEAGAAAKNATVLALGEQHEQKAEQVDGGAFAPHLYLGSMLLAQGDAPGAVAEYRLFLADHPPRATLSKAVPFLTKAFARDHQTLPALPLGRASNG